MGCMATSMNLHKVLTLCNYCWLSKLLTCPSDFRMVVRHNTYKRSMSMTSIVIFSSHGWFIKVKVRVSRCDRFSHLCAACDWLMTLRKFDLWLLPVAKQDETVYMIGWTRKKVNNVDITKLWKCKHAFKSFSLGSKSEEKTDCKFVQERRDVCSCCRTFTD